MRTSGVVWVFGSVAEIVPITVSEAIFSFIDMVNEEATNEGALLTSNTVIVTVAVEERLTPAPLLATWTRRVYTLSNKKFKTLAAVTVIRPLPESIVNALFTLPLTMLYVSV